MAIAKKPSIKPIASDDDAAERFISGAVKAAPQPIPEPEPVAPRAKRKPAMMRFDPDLLERIDAAARKRGISRSAWIQYTLSEALEGQR